MGHNNESALAVGDLDVTFGLNGIASLDNPSNPGTMLRSDALAIDPTTDIAQRIYVGATGGGEAVGVCYVVRLLANGQLDISFGQEGYLLAPTGDPERHGTIQEVTDLVFGPSGEITCFGRMLGYTPYGLRFIPVAFRVTPAGVIDSGFGVKGLAIYDSLPPPKAGAAREELIPLSQDEREQAIQSRRRLVQEGKVSDVSSRARLVDGKILFLAKLEGWPPPWRTPTYLARINTDGSLDTTFGQEGLVLVTDPATEPPETVDGWSLDIDRDGGVIVVGDLKPLNTVVGVVIRYDSQGRFDQQFGRSGIVYLYAGEEPAITSARSVKALEDGKSIIQAALLPDGTVEGVEIPLIIKLLRNGERDPDFNKGKPAQVDFSPSPYLVKTLDIDDAGRIVISGYKLTGAAPDIAGCISRFMPRGMPDETFGVEGTRIYEDFGLFFNQVVIQSRVNILVAIKGYSNSGIARFIG